MTTCMAGRGASALRLVMRVAAIVTLLGAHVAVARADDALSRRGISLRLAAELLILRGDTERLDRASGLSPRNREGLRARIAGALGLLPWLLREAGDAPGADRLRAWQERPVADHQARTALVADLDALIARHPLGRAAFVAPPPTQARLTEAKAIYGAYCSACHDGVGDGAPDAALPARDLFRMAQGESQDEFLARLVAGVKGDAAIRFANPLTEAQIGAMAAMFRRGPSPAPILPEARGASAR